jgi:hypothetical protein
MRRYACTSFCAWAAERAARLHDGAGGLHLLVGLHQLIAGDRSGCLRCLLQTVVRAPGGGQLRLGLGAVGLGRLDLRLGLRDLRLQFGRAQFREQLALLHRAAAVDRDPLDVARDFSVDLDGEERLDFAGEVERPRDGLRDDGNEVGRLLGERRDGGEREKARPHNIDSPDRGG